MKQPVNFKWEHYEPDILIELLDKRIKKLHPMKS
ncbi:hypothetical protein DJ94_1100 [Bacillus pseudomycoides]|nr:hypothetical protein DJ94_1100 [Bacillus pseudomycoides]